MTARGPDMQAVRALGVRRMTVDSRAVRPGDTFVAYPGESRDGRDYIAQAVHNGAAAVLWDADGYAWNRRIKVPNLGIAQLRSQAGVIASEIYGKPSARLWTIGITGTNGKTSCSQWIAQALTRARRKCAVIGTLGSGFAGRLDAQANTTPDAVSLHARMRSFVRGGAQAVCMEASSHGLAQDRLAGVEFDVAMLTNLTRDHLDYHGTMRRYKAAKARLFRWPTLSHAVVNMDDAFGCELAQHWKHRRAAVLGYGFARRSARLIALCREPRDIFMQRSKPGLRSCFGGLRRIASAVQLRELLFFHNKLRLQFERPPCESDADAKKSVCKDAVHGGKSGDDEFCLFGRLHDKMETSRFWCDAGISAW